jgi:hypothetical protein
LLAGVVVVLAATAVAALLHEMQPRMAPQPVVTNPAKPQPAALTAEEEGYAAALWDIHREVTPSAVAMSYAGIAYQTETHDERQLAEKIEPLAKFFGEAETRVRALAVPLSLAGVKGQYADAMALYASAAGEMLKFTRDRQTQHLADAHRMGISASETVLRVGEVLWPGQYKPH